MRIDLNYIIANEVTAQRSTKNVNTSKQTDATTSTSSSEDQASFMEMGMSLPSLVDQAMQPPDSREERVAALKDAIQSGQYSVDPQTVADAMLVECGQ